MKKILFKLIAIAIPIPMLLASCSSEEPSFTPEEEAAIKNGTDVKYSKPIIFETENTEWFTEYNVVNNIYTTKISAGTAFFKIKDGYHMPTDLKITKVAKEQDGKFQNIDVSKEREGFKYTADILTITRESDDMLAISLSRTEDSYDYRYYHIYLSDNEDKYGTKIIIDDSYWEKMLTGYFPLNFDLSEIKYPSKRHHNESTGHYKGYEYSIWLPGDECELELPTTADCYIYTISLFGLLDSEEEILYQFKYNYDLPQTDESNQPLTEVLTEVGEFRFVKFDKNDFALKSKIFENQSGQERKISIRIQGSSGGALINFIQAAK